MNVITHPAPITAADPAVVQHFQASARLYRSWSPDRHLHFGYCRWPILPWDRKAMLEAMVHEVVRPLAPRAGARLADLGCGYGSAARLIARYYHAHVDAFTIIPEQFVEGTRCCEMDRCTDRVSMHLCDMRETMLRDGGMDAVIGIESWCYGQGEAKDDVIREAARILGHNGRISVVDGFIMKEPGTVRGGMLRTVEKGWALPCFPRWTAFKAALQRHGFRNIQAKDLGWRVGFSALHGPPLMLLTVIRQWVRNEPLDELELAHLRSCMLGILMGTQRDLFRYLMVTAEKA